MKTMITDWLKGDGLTPSNDARIWLETLGEDATMAQAWADCRRPEWMLWMIYASDACPDDNAMRKLACAFVRRTPLADGRAVWDLLRDKRSRNAVEVAERYADGNATVGELAAAREAANVAANEAAKAAWEAAWEAAKPAANAAAREAANVAANAAAKEAAMMAAREAANVAANEAAKAAWEAAWEAANVAANAAAKEAAKAAWAAAREAAKPAAWAAAKAARAAARAAANAAANAAAKAAARAAQCAIIREFIKCPWGEENKEGNI